VTLPSVFFFYTMVLNSGHFIQVVTIEICLGVEAILVLQDATLNDEGVKSGDLLLIEAGRLPPKVVTHKSTHLVMVLHRDL